MGHRINGKDVVAVLSGNLRPRMVETLKRCKPHYRVACITATSRPYGPSMTRDPLKPMR